VYGKIGYPKTIRVDQGSEFISRDLDLWAYMNGVTLDFSRPGKPTDNAFIEAFNGRLRAECLSANWFMSLSDAREKLECWRGDYSTVRPHSAIGNTPGSADQSRRRHHSACVKRPENSRRKWSKVGSQSTSPKTSLNCSIQETLFQPYPGARGCISSLNVRHTEKWLPGAATLKTRFLCI
jgi:hypothetical protein